MGPGGTSSGCALCPSRVVIESGEQALARAAPAWPVDLYADGLAGRMERA